VCAEIDRGLKRCGEIRLSTIMGKLIMFIYLSNYET